MNGMAQNSWPYVIAAYAVTWVVLIGYAWYLWRVVKDAKAQGARSLGASEPSVSSNSHSR
jgi:hypothetical protein